MQINNQSEKNIAVHMKSVGKTENVGLPCTVISKNSDHYFEKWARAAFDYYTSKKCPNKTLSINIFVFNFLYNKYKAFYNCWNPFYFKDIHHTL